MCVNIEENYNEAVINPYTFIDLNTAAPERNLKEKGNLTGWVDCCIKTKTPLIVLDTESVRNDNIIQEHKIYSFYKDVDGNPCIPGSQIRGVIRNVYEALTNSCLSTTNDISIGYRAQNFKAKPGVLKKEGKKWVIYPAECHKLNTGKREYRRAYPAKEATEYRLQENGKIKVAYNNKIYSLKNFDKVSFNSIPKKGKKGVITNYVNKIFPISNIGKYEGYLLLMPEADTSKLYNNIMVIKENSLPIKISDGDKPIEMLKNTVDLYIENAKDKSSYPSYENLDLDKFNENGTPLWYVSIDNKVYLSFSQRGRQALYNSLKTVLGEHYRCQTKEKLCKGCQLFGMVGDKTSIGGALRFTDAKYKGQENPYNNDNITLQELASPKITATEFYTKRPKSCDIWNYDYSVTNGKENNINATINGRKFYWHHKPNTLNAEKTIRNTTVQAVEKDNKFDFRIYFENITENQLNELIWTINLGENSIDGHMCHKLGHAKPLGYGSVKICVQSINVRDIKLSASNESIVYNIIPKKISNDIQLSDIIKENRKKILAIADFNTTDKETIAYPIGDDGKNRRTSVGTMQWFMLNKGGGSDSKVNLTLRTIDGNIPIKIQDFRLPKYKK